MLTRLNGFGSYWPEQYPTAVGLAYSSGLVIDATGEMTAFIGRVFFNERTGTKAIRKVHIRFGAVTKSGGSALTLSLQNVATATGPVAVPDEAQDQTAAIANADAAFATDTWYTTGNLSADRTVAYGELLAVVVEYDGAGRLSTDSVVVSSISSGLVSGTYGHQGLCALKTGGAWAVSLNVPVILLEFSDGTFGTFLGALPWSAVSSIAYKSDSAADEVALRLVYPVNLKTDGAFVSLQIAANTADFDVVLYQGTTALATVSVDANQTRSTNNDFVHVLFSSEISITAGVEYFLSVKPTQATSNVRQQFFDVAAAGHMAVMPLGTSAYYASRVDAGSWTPVTTRRPLSGLRISSLDFGAPRAQYRIGL